MRSLRNIQPLNAAITVVLVLLVVLGSYLGWAVWDHKRAVEESTMPARDIKVLMPMIKKSPKDVNLRMQLAQDYMVLKKYPKAIEQYKKVLSIHKNFVPALSGLGFVALEQKEFKTAEGYFRRIVELLEERDEASNDQTLEIAYFYLGTALYEQKQYEDAASFLKQALLIRRDASDTHYLLAVCFRELGSDRSYRESLENALMFDPKHPEANYDLAKLLLKEGDEAAAAEHLRVSADAAANSDKPLEALEKLGPFKKRLAKARELEKSAPAAALAEARIAVALSPRSTDALMLLGSLYEKTGNKEAAVNAYRRVIALDPDNTDAQTSLERMTDGS